MSNELTAPDASIAIGQHIGEPGSVLELIARMAVDPRCDPDKLGKLLDLKERLDNKQAEIDFNKAFSEAKRRMPRITKDGVIDMGAKGKIAFARYEDLNAAIEPIEREFGFTRSFLSDPTEKGVLMIVKLAHAAGYSERSTMQLPPDPGPGRNALQALGSSHSYGKRYLTLNIWDIVCVGADDDAQSVGFIDERQANNIIDMLTGCETDKLKYPALESNFLTFMGAKSVGEILKVDYPKAVQALQSKLRANKEGR